MNKRIVIAITCLLFSIGISFGKSLVLTLANNTLVYYMLGGTKNPMMRFADSKVCVESYEYTFSNIKWRCIFCEKICKNIDPGDGLTRPDLFACRLPASLQSA